MCKCRKLQDNLWELVILSYGSQGSNSSHQSWWQVPLPNDPSHSTPPNIKRTQFKPNQTGFLLCMAISFKLELK